jgi:hypothetical protein
MASKPGAWYAFPWETWGTGKYVVLLPFVAAVALGADDADSWAWHMLALAALRYAHAAGWNTLSRMHAVSAATRITAKPVEFKQVDREDNWDDYILLQALVMTLVHNTPHLGFGGFPGWNARGLVQLALLHAGPTEWLYYWLHRALHWHPLYQRYHSHHHASFVAEPITGACATATACAATRAARRDGHRGTQPQGFLRERQLVAPQPATSWRRGAPDRGAAAPPPRRPPRVGQQRCRIASSRGRRTRQRRRRHARARARHRSHTRTPRVLARRAHAHCVPPARPPPLLTRPPAARCAPPGSVHPFAEHLMYTANFAIPLLGTWAAGGASWSMFYIYLLGFDLLNAIGHCNFEFVPTALFKARRGARAAGGLGAQPSSACAHSRRPNRGLRVCGAAYPDVR